MYFKQKRQVWKFPWSYREAFIIAGGLSLTGVLIELFSGQAKVPVPGFPFNLYFGLFVAGFIVYGHIVLRKHPLVKFLQSVPAAVGSLSMLGVLALVMALYPQHELANQSFADKMGLHHILSHWSYVFSFVFVLVSLGFVVLKRLRPFTLKNAGFLLNHFGLWLSLFAAGLGAGDIEKLQLTVNEGKTMWIARDMKGNNVELPLAIRLNDFRIDYFKPKLAIVSTKSQTLVVDKPSSLPEAVVGQTIIMKHWIIKVDTLLEDAALQNRRFVFDTLPGSVVAAYISATNRISKEQKEGWLTPGSFVVNRHNLKLDNSYQLALIGPEPSKFESDVTIFTKRGEKTDTKIVVNKPVKAMAYTIYQTSYDAAMGKHSAISVFELVKDPWLPLVYTGIYMMLAGALFLIFAGNLSKK